MLARAGRILRYNIIPTILHPLVENHIYTARQGIAKGMKRKGGLGFIPFVVKPTPEEKFLTSLNLDSQIVFDVGAAHGIYTIFFANAVGANGQVVAFEPNPRLCDQTIGNVGLNFFNNVQVCQIALGRKKKKKH